jgi:hypothetical protein
MAGVSVPLSFAASPNRNLDRLDSAEFVVGAFLREIRSCAKRDIQDPNPVLELTWKPARKRKIA